MDLWDRLWMQRRDEKTIHITLATPHKRACTLTYMRTEENTCPHTYHHCSSVGFYLDAKSMWNAWWVMMMWGFEAASWMEDPIWLSPSVSLPCYASDFHSEGERERDSERGRARITQDHATTEIVWGQQCHNYFKMSDCNKIQQFIWQKAN